MNMIYVGLETLKSLYTRGYITGEALTVLAPINWISENYPELLENPDQIAKAIAPVPQKTCDGCVHFSSVHSCCMTRIDEEGVYLQKSSDSKACIDFDRVELPYFLK